MASRNGKGDGEREAVGEALTAETPRVSVVIPAYNAARYIGEALDSVFAQSYDDLEVIVVNDGSPDTATLERVLEPYRDRVRYHRQENAGPGAARNAGIARARGRYVAFLDSDDQWLPEFLASQVAFLEAQPGVDLVYCDAAIAGMGPGRTKTFMQEFPSTGAVTVESLLRGSCVVITSCVVARRAALSRAGLFDETLYYSEDFDLWLRLLDRGGRIGYHTGVLALRQEHPQSLTAQTSRFLRAHLQVLEKVKRTLTLSRALRALVDERLIACRAELGLHEGRDRLLAGDYGVARREFQHAERCYRTVRLRAMILLLRIWPGLARRVYVLRERLIFPPPRTQEQA